MCVLIICTVDKVPSPEPTTAATEETDGTGTEKAEQKGEDGTEGVVANEGGGKTEPESDLNREGDTEQGTKSSNEDKDSEKVDVQSDPHNLLSPTEHRLSYLKATDHVEDSPIDEGDIPKIKEKPTSLPFVNETKQDSNQRKKIGGKRISRSTSSPSAGARIRLQESMGLRSIPGIGAATSPLLLRSSLSTSRSGLSASFPPPSQDTIEEENSGTSRMARLLESEAQTGSYSCPLVGCIPASALKYFAEKEERKRFSMSPVSSTSPSLVYEQSGVYLHVILAVLL